MGNSKANPSSSPAKSWIPTSWQNLRLKWSKWEYWPFLIIYAPLFIYWIWLSLKARSPIFFVAANPGIMGGGISGESKHEIYKKVPARFLPKTFFVDRDQSADLKTILPQLQFPVFAKPDVGKRGRLVKKINEADTLIQYFQQLNIPMVIQENIAYEEEFSVYYYCFPEAEKGQILSLVSKEYPSVTGDGLLTVEQLIDRDRRLTFFAKKLKPLLSPQILASIPEMGKKLILSKIGNHAQGTIFHDSRPLIDEALTATFDDFFRRLSGIHIGRVDLKSPSLEALRQGIFQVVEINGVGAELAHIYSANYSFFKAQREIFHSWDIIYQISRQNRTRGIEIVPIRHAFNHFSSYLRYSRQVKKLF